MSSLSNSATAQQATASRSGTATGAGRQGARPQPSEKATADRGLRRTSEEYLPLHRERTTMPRTKMAFYLARALFAVCGLNGLNALTTCCAFGTNLPWESFHVNTGRRKTATSSLESTRDDATERTNQHNDVVRSKILDLLRDIDGDSSPSSERTGRGVKSTVVHLVGTGREAADI